ncbi:hypothetical protein [Thioalkalivibrio paradoxus]|uniref:Uncharacterized protein n=1 Tax=Thioalkalivibrio paradoxus ARh 1 TaxID=713585 RepID=W0DMN5_9GAMM|nr:hypothetical protein [Thioalkalivibrio paradoxus]AHE99854.1 hypothetical protein THITH_01780 [Thioalkalivibrio paradoxus ARh 1]
MMTNPAHADSVDRQPAIDELARIAVAGERRLQRLERLFRWTALLFVTTLALGSYAMVQLFSAGSAQAQLGWPYAAPPPAPEAIAPPLRSEPLDAPAQPAAPDLHSRILALREQLAGVEDHAFDSGHLLAVILYEIREVLHDTRLALEVMPQMGDDVRQMRADMGRIAATMGTMDQKMTGVPLMAEEMRRLNTNIDIMTTSIDSTMGRMGRMMPYFW